MNVKMCICIKVIIEASVVKWHDNNVVGANLDGSNEMFQCSITRSSLSMVSIPLPLP